MLLIRNLAEEGGVSSALRRFHLITQVIVKTSFCFKKKKRNYLEIIKKYKKA